MIQSDLSGHSDRLPLVLVRVRKLRSAGRWDKSREGLIRVIATHIQENVAFARLVKALHSTPYRDSFVTLDDSCGVGCPARATRITASQRQLRDRESQVPEIVKIVNRGHSFVARERMPELSKTTVSLAVRAAIAKANLRPISQHIRNKTRNAPVRNTPAQRPARLRS